MEEEVPALGRPRHFHISTTPPMRFTEVTGPGETIEVDFCRWLSITWVDIVGHPNPDEYRKHLSAGTGVDYAQGLKLTDPRRMAVYFAKYGTSGGKEYQHEVPKEWIGGYLVCTDCGGEYEEDRDECPDCGCQEGDLIEPGTAGRFWCYRGLQRVLALRQVTPEVGIAAARIARRWSRSKRLTKKISVERVEQSTGRIYCRRTPPTNALPARERLHLHERRRGIRLPARHLPHIPKPDQALPRGAGTARSRAVAGASVERPAGRTTF